MVFDYIIKLRIAVYREMEKNDLILSKLFSDNGLDKISRIGSNNHLLMLHETIKATISEKERDIIGDQNIFTLFNLGSYVERQIESLIKEGNVEFDILNVPLPEIKISERFLESDKPMVKLGSIPEPSKDTEKEALREKVEKLCEVTLAGLEQEKFREGYYERQ